MGGTAGNIARGVGGAFTGGVSELFQKNPFGGGIAGRALPAVMTGGLSEFTKKNPFGVPIYDPGSIFGGRGNQNNPYISGPFSLDPNQLTADQQNITDLGSKQYTDTLSAIDKNAQAQQDYAGQTLQRELPNIYEDLNSRHLLNSSALPAEIARQATSSAQDIASQVSQAKMSALAGRQGFETGALQRGQSLEDFVNQANVAKSIGAQMAPIQPNGKQNFGTVAQGVGALAPIAKLAIK